MALRFDQPPHVVDSGRDEIDLVLQRLASVRGLGDGVVDAVVLDHASRSMPRQLGAEIGLDRDGGGWMPVSAKGVDGIANV